LNAGYENRFVICICLKEVVSLTEEVARLHHQLEESAKRGKSEDDAMYHLQMAQATLNERYSKLQNKNAELQKRFDHKMMKLVN